MLTRVKKRLSSNRRMLHLHDKLQCRLASEQSSRMARSTARAALRLCRIKRREPPFESSRCDHVPTSYLLTLSEICSRTLAIAKDIQEEPEG